VGPSEATSSTGNISSSESTSTPTDEPPASNDTSGTTNEDGCDEDGCNTTTFGSGGTSGDESVGGTGESDPGPCSGWIDEFDDGVFAEGWTIAGDAGGPHLLQEVDGELRWELGAGYTGAVGLRRSLDSLAAGMRIELGASPSTHAAQAQLVLLLREGDAPPGLYLIWVNGQLHIRVQEKTLATLPESAWVDVRLLDQQVMVSVSNDGTTFEEVVAEDLSFDPAASAIWLYGQTWTDAPNSSVGSFASVHVCEH